MSLRLRGGTKPVRNTSHHGEDGDQGECREPIRSWEHLSADLSPKRLHPPNRPNRGVAVVGLSGPTGSQGAVTPPHSVFTVGGSGQGRGMGVTAVDVPGRSGSVQGGSHLASGSAAW